MNYRAIILLAEKHVHNGAAMQSSAELCLDDAVQCAKRGAFESARMWALKSLAYSVGISHADYRSAADTGTPWKAYNIPESGWDSPA